MSVVPPIEAITVYDRRDRVRHACRAVGDSSLAAAWEAEVRALCADPTSASSNLAAGGDPVEFQCVWSQNDGSVGVRLTVDPDPAATPLVRQARCLALASSCTTEQVRDLLPQWGRRADLGWRYGGWIGTRLRDGVFHRKLYLEIPAGAVLHSWPLLRSPALQDLPVRAFAPIMMGLDPMRPGIEIYGQMAPMQAAALALMCDRFDFPRLAPLAIHLLEALMQQRVATRMPAAEQGLSVAMDAKGDVLSLTWYAHCDALLGPPRKAREALLLFGIQQKWEMAEYAALSAPDEAGHVPWHGVVGLTVCRDARVLLSVTCSTRPEDKPR